MFRWTVIEIRKASSIVALDGEPMVTSACWNILFSSPHKSEEEASVSFDGCLMWLEQNRVKGSEYVITEMYFVPPIKQQPNGN